MGEDRPISENLSEYRKAMEEELRVAPTLTSDSVAEKARQRLFEILPEAVDELMGIMRIGTKDDAVRLNAIKMVIEGTLGKPGPAKPEESDIDKLINSMQKKKAEETTKAA